MNWTELQWLVIGPRRTLYWMVYQ